MSAEKWMDGMIDRLTMSLKPYLPSLCSPVAAVADPWESVIDKNMSFLESQGLRLCEK